MLRVHGEVLPGGSMPPACSHLKDNNEESIGVVATRPVNYDKR